MERIIADYKAGESFTNLNKLIGASSLSKDELTSLLRQVCAFNNTETQMVVAYLISVGADANIGNGAPLRLAVNNDNVPLVRFMCDHTNAEFLKAAYDLAVKCNHMDSALAIYKTGKLELASEDMRPLFCYATKKQINLCV